MAEQLVLVDLCMASTFGKRTWWKPFCTKFASFLQPNDQNQKTLHLLSQIKKKHQILPLKQLEPANVCLCCLSSNWKDWSIIKTARNSLSFHRLINWSTTRCSSKPYKHYLIVGMETLFKCVNPLSFISFLPPFLSFPLSLPILHPPLLSISSPSLCALSIIDDPHWLKG